MKAGDVIPIDKQETIEARVDGVPVLTGNYGSVNKQYALKVESMMSPALLAFKKESFPHE